MTPLRAQTRQGLPSGARRRTVGHEPTEPLTAGGVLPGESSRETNNLQPIPARTFASGLPSPFHTVSPTGALSLKQVTLHFLHNYPLPKPPNLSASAANF